LRTKVALLVWALVLLIGAAAARIVPAVEPRGPLLVAAPKRVLGVAEQFANAQLESPLHGAESQRQLANAAKLRLPLDFDAQPAALADVRLASWVRPNAEPAVETSVATIAPPDGAAKLLLAAMSHAPASIATHAFGLLRPGHERTALAALEAASPSAQMIPDGFSAYGELEPDIFDGHRLTILQLGDSHTAADLFTGRVRERLQQVFGTGGDAYIVPGKPHLGVRSALFECDASDGWSYEALQKSDASTRRFYLTGFNAVAHHAGASLALRSRGGRAYDRLEVAFLKQPGGGRAQVLVDGSPSGEINLDGAADERATLALRAPEARASQGFHEIAVKALSDAPVTVTGVDVGREGDGVSYISLGFPGATVQLLQKLTTENIADDFRHMAPDIVVLAFGTNEGFNDNLDIGAYTAQYEQIVHRLMGIRPGLRVVLIGPPDGARPASACHAAGVGQECGSAPIVQVSAGEGGGQCRFPTPPKLAAVREAQRKLAQRLGAEFWDWSSAMPGPCGAQIWAAANPPLMAHDYVHMTLEGYKQSADRFADFLIPLIGGRQTRTHVVSNN
jgi:GDSL-like Lipase/Acylhydrolase family